MDTKVLEKAMKEAYEAIKANQKIVEKEKKEASNINKLWKNKY